MRLVEHIPEPTDDLAVGLRFIPHHDLEMIEERPFTAVAIALGIGFLIGRFGRTDQ